ncbi:hypothetical protein V2J09_007438 [Rumex salicifolius]
MSSDDGESEHDKRSRKKKKMVKQLTASKREDTPLTCAARGGDLEGVIRIVEAAAAADGDLKDMLSNQNQSGETALYAASENGHVDVLMDADPSLSMTYDSSNTTALQIAATQGHLDVVSFLLESGSGLATIARSNGKNALHSAARNGHVEVAKVLMENDPEITIRVDKKGQTALHMAVKGQNVGIVDELILAMPSSVNLVDTKGNTPLHVATRKGRAEIVKRLLSQKELDKTMVNKAGETAIDTAEKSQQQELARILEEGGVVSAKVLKPQASNPAKQLKQTVSDIKHEVHHQMEHTRQTRRRVQGIAKRLNKMHGEGLNNAINSTTVVAVLIASIAFAAIFTVPGQYVSDPKNIPPGSSLGEAIIAHNAAFLIFFVFDAVALFISLAVVVVQTSVVVIERKAKKRMMAIINKLMWLACVLISVAFLALSFVVVGEKEKWLAIGVTVIGTIIMTGTLGLMCYWVIQHHIEAIGRRNIRKSSMGSKSRSWSASLASDPEAISTKKYKKMYAI